MASENTLNSIDFDNSSVLCSKQQYETTNTAKDDSNPQSATVEQARLPNVPDKERKIGHRRVGEGGEITYKKIQTSQIMGSIQLGIQHTVGSLASKPKRDLLMMDFWEVESITFPPEGSTLTPAHHYSEFKYKIYAPIAFRYFRDLFGIQPDDFMMSMCSSPLRELSNPGASGSIFYLTNDDEFIIKTVQHKEGEFLQKLLPGYYMNLNQNPRTLLPKFFGLYCLQTSNSKNIRLIVMNNLLPSYVKMHLKYDLKGSTFKRKASKAERSKKSPTYKDLDFMEHHPNGIFLESETYSALIKTIQRDCTVLESFKIMDYSLLVGVHNLDVSSKEKQEERNKSKLPKAYESDDDLPDTSQDLHSRDSDIATGITRNSMAYRSANRQRLVAHSTAMESIQAESEPIDDEADVPPGGIPARSEKGERLLLFVGIIDILQSYRLKKKLEHTLKSIIHDGETVSVCRPSFYAQRFQSFMAKTVFRKIPSLDLPEIKGNHRKFRTLVTSYIALKHSPSKRKSLSKAIQRSIENETENKSATQYNSHGSKTSHQNKQTLHHSNAEQSVVTTAPKQKSSGASNLLKPKVPPPVPPRGSPRKKEIEKQKENQTTRESAINFFSQGIYNHENLNNNKKKYSKPPTNKVDSTPNNFLKVENEWYPRFGEQRSPSNVQDWLEIHDMFEKKNNQTASFNRVPSFRTETIKRRASIKSAYSTAFSEARSQTSHANRLSHMGIFQRQNAFLGQKDGSTIGSIVCSFPHIESSNDRKNYVGGNSKRQGSKKNDYLQYVDLGLSVDNCEEQEDNIIHTVNAFLEVKNEFEKIQFSRDQRQLNNIE